MAGGGAAGQTRGGYVTFSGNEHASTGKVEILAGDVTGGTIDFYTLGAQVAQFDRSVTATHARFLVYCVDTATMERVKTGPAASGPGGSGRALYVA